MRILKNIWIYLCAVSLVGGMCSFQIVYAAEDDNYQEVQFEYNEYEAIVNDKSKLAMVENDNIYEKRLLELNNHIIEMNKCTDEELIDQGYTNEQIYAIRNYDGSEKMMREASAEVTGVLIIYSRKVENNNTYITIKCSGSYNGTFVQQFKDNLGMYVVSSDSIFAPINNSITMSVTYADGHTVNSVEKKIYGTGVRFTFAVQNMRSFEAYYKGVAQGVKTVVNYAAAYGHHYLSGNFDGLSISNDSSVSAAFSLKWYCDEIFYYIYTKEY